MVALHSPNTDVIRLVTWCADPIYHHDKSLITLLTECGSLSKKEGNEWRYLVKMRSAETQRNIILTH